MNIAGFSGQQRSNMRADQEGHGPEGHVMDLVGQSDRRLHNVQGHSPSYPAKAVSIRGATNILATVPKFISPGLHRWLDVLVSAYFVGIGARFSARGKKGPAAGAFLNATMVAGVSLLTDYEGTGNKPVSFKLHGAFDALQAVTVTLVPVVLGFGGKREAGFFYAQAFNEVAVIVSTDWNSGTSAPTRLRAA